MSNHYSNRTVQRVLLSMVMLFAVLSVSAQNQISVKSEEYDDQETTAMVNPHKDRNNKDCALVIFHNVEPEGYLFDGKGVYVKAQNHVSRDNGEKTIFLYIADGAKNITIKHTDPGIAPFTYQFENGPLRGRSTYHVYLGQVFKASAVGSQYLEFRVSPSNAILEVEEDRVSSPGVYTPWPLDASGKASKLKRYGSYRYRVSAPDYHTSGGEAMVNNPNEPQVETITLKPNFGYVTIAATDDLEGATIFIDGRQAGTSSLSRYRLASGSHVIKISKPLFKLYEQNVTITDGQEERIAPVLESNAARINISTTNKDADIYLRLGSNDRRLGKGSWSGPLEPGDYLVVCKQVGHKESMKQITVRKNGATNFQIPAPQAMYGSINITSSPSGAHIMLDGQDMGVTPKVINNVIATQHSITLTKPGYNDYRTSVTVNDGAMAEVKGTLTNVCTVKVGGNGMRYTVWAHGKRLEPVNGVYRVSRGTTITVDAVGYYGYTDKRKEYLINTNRDITINLSRRLLHGNEFYIDIAGVSTGYFGMGVSMGFNAGGFNMQADFDYPFSDKEFEFYPIGESVGYNTVNFAASVRFGWTIRIGTRFRLTPQIGYRATMLSNDSSREEESSTISSIPLSLRMNLQLGYRCSIFFSPEYQFKVDGDAPAMHLYGKAHDWAAGPSFRFGFSFNF